MTADARGYTLIEVLIALVILGISMLGVQALITDRLVGTVGEQDQLAVANQLAKDRIARIEIDPVYFTLEARYEGTENPVPGNPQFVRSTRIVRNASPDYKTVTVRVWTALMRDTVSRTTIVAAP